MHYATGFNATHKTQNRAIESQHLSTGYIFRDKIQTEWIDYTIANDVKCQAISCSEIDIIQWASYQVRKIAGCACAGNAGNVFPAIDVKGNR